jgi:hypothetical protein
MTLDAALMQWNPADRDEARALVRAVQAHARQRGLSLTDPPAEPTNCCDSECIGCVWDAYCSDVAYWRDEALLRWSD